MNLSNLKINPTRTVALANEINARETSKSVRKYICGSIYSYKMVIDIITLQSP
jgi:hypothetical protein